MYTGGYSTINNLIFGYDADVRSSRFYKGEPTSDGANIFYNQNPRIDINYILWTLYDNQGTFARNHPNRIKVYGKNGVEISNYVNQGVPDWTNKRHAYWVYDSYLNKPVVQMNDENGSWQAKSFNVNLNNLFLNYKYEFLSIGSKYTISWLQWTTNLTKRVNVGVYSKNLSNVWNFYDGLSNGSTTSTNTETYTWQRVYHTFTLSNDFYRTNPYSSVYFYGQDFINGETLKISDVQIDLTDHPTNILTFFFRRPNETLIDLKRKIKIDLIDVSFDSNSNMVFDGTNDNIKLYDTNYDVVLGSYFFPLLQFSLEFVIKTTGLGSGMSLNGIFSLTYGITVYINSSGDLGFRVDNGINFTHFITTGMNLNDDKYHHIVCSNDGNYSYIYIDNVYIGSLSSIWNGTTQWPTDYVIIGRDNNDTNYYFNGYIDIVKIYNKVLSSGEVNNNFNSLYKRFNINKK